MLNDNNNNKKKAIAVLKKSIKALDFEAIEVYLGCCQKISIKINKQILSRRALGPKCISSGTDYCHCVEFIGTTFVESYIYINIASIPNLN